MYGKSYKVIVFNLVYILKKKPNSITFINIGIIVNGLIFNNI